MTIEVKPLNAIVYNQDKVNMTDVIAPPYDVISDDYRDELEKRSVYNFVKLIWQTTIQTLMMKTIVITKRTKIIQNGKKKVF